jgi:hypothetical protein
MCDQLTVASSAVFGSTRDQVAVEGATKLPWITVANTRLVPISAKTQGKRHSFRTERDQVTVAQYENSKVSGLRARSDTALSAWLGDRPLARDQLTVVNFIRMSRLPDVIESTASPKRGRDQLTVAVRRIRTPPTGHCNVSRSDGRKAVFQEHSNVIR